MKNAKDNRRQTSAAMERYSALHRRPCSRYLDLQPQQRLNLQAQGEEGKLIGRHHRERMRQCSISFGGTNYTN